METKFNLGQTVFIYYKGSLIPAKIKKINLRLDDHVGEQIEYEVDKRMGIPMRDYEIFAQPEHFLNAVINNIVAIERMK